MKTHASTHIWYNPLSMDRAGNKFLDIKHTQHSLIHICVYIYIINSLWQTTGASPLPSPRRRQQKTWFGPVACSPGAALWRAPPPRTPSTHSVAVAAVRPWCLPETLLCRLPIDSPYFTFVKTARALDIGREGSVRCVAPVCSESTTPRSAPGACQMAAEVSQSTFAVCSSSQASRRWRHIHAAVMYCWHSKFTLYHGCCTRQRGT